MTAVFQSGNKYNDFYKNTCLSHLYNPNIVAFMLHDKCVFSTWLKQDEVQCTVSLWYNMQWTKQGQLTPLVPPEGCWLVESGWLVPRQLRSQNSDLDCSSLVGFRLRTLTRLLRTLKGPPAHNIQNVLKWTFHIISVMVSDTSNCQIFFYPPLLMNAFV